MEQKKLDLNAIIGFVLIFGILMWIMYQNQPTQAEIDKKKAEKAKTEKAAQQQSASSVVNTTQTDASNPETLAKLQSALGSFAYSASLPSAKENFTTIENEYLKLTIANKGGYIAEVTLKGIKQFSKDSGKLVSLIKNKNASLNIALQTKDNRVLNTKDLFFEPTLSKIDGNQILSMKLKAGENQYLEYKYILRPKEYMVDFDLHSQGLSTLLNTSKAADLEWQLKTYRNEKSVSYENRYTDIHYEYEEDKTSYVSGSKESEETPKAVNYIAYKQHFFSSILLTDKPFSTSKLSSKDLVVDEKIDTLFTKQFKALLPLAYDNGEVNYKMKWYFGPTDYKTLKAYDKNLDRIIPLGWGIFGWINKYIFSPLYGFLSDYISYGIAIIIFTVLIKLAMSPITYKSFLSQAKMKVLRPEITDFGEKYKKDPMKKQQETMKLYNKAGVNPMAGCIPALIQLPFMYASFQFFPSAYILRQKSFLWADDLSSFDQIFKLPFNIPLYGDHVSLFPILAAIAIFFYMKMTTGDQQMAAPQQEGMPDMGKIMKMMIYISPIMMLIFFNSYGSGLSLYNFISNLITIGIMYVIKNYIVDSDKIHAEIQENKLKEPKKPGKFQQRLQQAMEQAEAQKKNKK